MTLRQLTRTAIQLTATLLTAAILLTATGSPAVAAASGNDRWTPPARHRSSAFTTTDISWSDGTVTAAAWPSDQLPVALVVEQALVDAVGLDRVRRGVQGWNGIAGSRFAAAVTDTVRDGIREARKDGVNRIFIDRNCKGDEAGWAHIASLDTDRAHGESGAVITEADIGICERVLSRPEVVVSTLRHEVGHLLGLDHQDGSCRIMAPRSGDCETLTEGDRQAVRHLYPTLPRLSGPSRIETAARVVYATHDARSADTIVLADGFGTSVQPVAAAALAGAIDAPLLLVSGDGCLDSAAGVELSRVAADAATVLLVGGAARCADAVAARGWTPVTLDGVGPIADELIRRRGSDTVLVIRGPHTDGNLPDGLTAAAAAGSLDAPVLLVDGGSLSADARRVLDANQRLRHAIIVGGEQAVPATVVKELRDRGLDVDRRAGADRIDTALAVATIPGAFPDQGSVLVAAADKWADTVSGSALGGARGWPVVLTWPHALDERVADLLTRRATGGFLLGGSAAVGLDAHLQATALVR